MVRTLWGIFVVSVIAVTFLCLSDTRSGARPRTPGVAHLGHTPDPVVDAPEIPAGREPVDTGSPEPSRGPSDPTVGVKEDAPGGAGGAEGTEKPGDASTAASRPTPEEFLASLVDLAKKGNLEELVRHMSPGAARLSRQLIMMILMEKAGQGTEALDKVFEQLTFEFEELADGCVRLHVQTPDGPPPEDVYLIPREGSWEVASESDLPGPLAESHQALNRLQLLALCQQTFFSEDLSGGGPAYAGTAGELAEALNESPIYANVLDPDLVNAVDTGSSYQGYLYGRIESGGNGFAYYATPEQYGPGARETLIIDNEGRMWAKDLQGGLLPSTWPEKQGWKRRRGAWN